MTPSNGFPRMLLTMLAPLLLMACSRSVHWEEQVPLNTGEVIWVQRSGTYSYRSESGNPLNFAYRPDPRSTIEFVYKGSKYSYTGDAHLVLLAIGPQGAPNLVASPGSDWGWRNAYYCVTPYYVQFRPNGANTTWAWPEQIDPWLYGLPTNLMFGLVPLDSRGKKFTASDRALENASVTVVHKHLRSIDPTHSINTCPRRNQ